MEPPERGFAWSAACGRMASRQLADRADAPSIREAPLAAWQRTAARNALLGALAVPLLLSPDASARQLVIGQSLGLTGGGAEVARQYNEGAKCYFDLLNGEGGVKGNRVRLVALDDGGNKDKTLENTKKLLDGEKAFALFGYTAAAG